MRPNAAIHAPTVIAPPIPPLNLYAKPMVKPRPVRIRPRQAKYRLGQPTVLMTFAGPTRRLVRTRPRRPTTAHVGGIGRLDQLHTASAVWPPTVTL